MSFFGQQQDNSWKKRYFNVFWSGVIVLIVMLKYKRVMKIEKSVWKRQHIPFQLL